MIIFKASGFDFNRINLLPKSKESKFIGSELSETFGYIPAYIEICPKCNNEVKWRTTGAIPMSLKCDKCNQEFKV